MAEKAQEKAENFLVNKLQVQAKKNELRLARMQKMARIGTWEWDIPDNHVNWSDELYIIYGLNPDQFGASFEAFLERIHPEDRDIIKKIIETVLTTHKSAEFEERIIRPDGSIRYLQSEAEVILDEEGKPLYMLGLCHDITDTREKGQAEDLARRLEESNRKVTEILESISNAFFSLDLDWKFTYINKEAEKMLGKKNELILGRSIWDEFPEAVNTIFYTEYERAASEQVTVEFEYWFPLLERWYSVRAFPSKTGLSVYFQDIHDVKTSEVKLKEESRINETLYRIGNALAAELDLEKLIQKITDESTQIIGAEFGSFFYNMINEKGESYMLYAISGVPREKFSKFPMPQNTAIFAPTFAGQSIVRLNDVTKDPRYGKNEPYYGMPEGHLPVKSYLAVPVISRSGEVLGGLFFGHSKTGVFTERDEILLSGIASQAAVAIDNANLYRQASEEKEKFRKVTEIVPNMIWTGGANGMIDYFSPAWYEFTAMKPDEMDNFNWQRLVHSEDVDQTLTTWRKSLNERKNFEVKCRFKRASDGTYRWHLCRGVPLINENGEVIKWFGTCTDIDEQIRSELTQKFLAEAGALFISSLDYEKTLENVARIAVPDFADWCAVDILKEGKISRLAVYHQEPEKIRLAKEFHELYPPAIDAPTGTGAVIRTGVSELMPEIPNEIIENLEDQVMKTYLKKLNLRSYMVVALKQQGKTIGSITFVNDEPNRIYTQSDLHLAEDLARRASMAIDNANLYVQAQKEKEETEKIKEKLRISNIELEKSNQELQNFAYVASHDLQEPLRSISGYAQLLERRYKDKMDDDANDFIGLITDGAKRMRVLIDDLLEYSKLGLTKINKTEININNVLNTAISNLDASIRENQAKITFDALPVIKVEPTLITQLFQNLISNAIKYRKPDEAPLIHISSRKENNKYLFSISDNGIGIEKQYFEKIFVIFHRLHGKLEYSGTGIGLATCKKIVHSHGGEIWLESEEGKGSTFCFTIPELNENK